MPKYGYIRVSLSEIISGQPNMIYSYPTGEDIDAEAVFDGTKAIREFLNLRECMLSGRRHAGIIFLSSP